jgi:hypothetical protein
MDDELRYSLCPACSNCPEVVIRQDGVTIGEDDNLVRLSAAEWNVLVEGVKSGALGMAPTSD